MKTIAGVDEVGRGSLIGPVYAAAVILNKSINKKLLKDSKSLRKNKREFLAKYIKKNSIYTTVRYGDMNRCGPIWTKGQQQKVTNLMTCRVMQNCPWANECKHEEI